MIDYEKVGGRLRARMTFEGSFVPVLNDLKVSQAAENEPAPVSESASDTDYVVKRFRFLSEELIWGLGYPVDYRKPGLLKDVEKYFQANATLREHYTKLDGAVGLVRNVAYNNKTKPPGLDGDLMIDRVLDPRLARQVETGVINRCSVFVSFYFSQSHEMHDRDFWELLGQEVDGELVRLVVEEIEWIREVSLVWFGADHTAKAFDTQQEQQALQQNQNNEEVLMDVIKRLKQKFSEISGKQNITDVELEIAVMQALDFQSEKAALEEKVREMSQEVAFAGTVKKKLREDVLAAAKFVHDDKIPEVEKSVLDAATYEQLLKFQEDYEKKKDAMVPLVCQDCQSKNVSRRSSVELEVKAPEVEAQEAKKTVSRSTGKQKNIFDSEVE